jgi:hypothetical protein
VTAAAGFAFENRDKVAREAAELAARQMADGGTVDVVEEDPSGLDTGRDADPAGQAGDAGGPESAEAVDAAERSRERQAGL